MSLFPSFALPLRRQARSAATAAASAQGIRPATAHPVARDAAPAGLQISAASKRFGAHLALKHVSLSIAPGEFVALLGPSGCGKTTLLRLLAGFESLSAGHIRLNGRTLDDGTTHLTPEQRRMGMVFQSYALWPHMSVADNVGYALRLQGIRGVAYRQRVQQALAQVELLEHAERAPQQLSGGQRQRVALARCLVTAPEVVLLDEPLANLDRHLRAAMEASFRDFHRRTRATLLYVTHDQNEAMALADRVAVMRDGELIQLATPETLYRRPRTPWVAGFIGHGRVLTLPGVSPGQTLDVPALQAALAQRQRTPRAPAQPVLIRPEHVTVQPASAAGLPATVRDSVFRGERHELHLALDDGSELLAYTSQPPPTAARVSLHLHQGWTLEHDA